MQGSGARKSDSRTRLFSFFGSSAVFSSSQTRPWLVFRRYANFFFSCSGPAREKWALGPGFSHFSGLAHGKWAPSPNFSSCPNPACEYQPQKSVSQPVQSSLFIIMQTLSHAPRITTFQTNTPVSAPHRSDLPAPPHLLPTPHAADRWLPGASYFSSSAGFPPDPAGCPHRNPARQNSRTRSRIRSYLQRRATAH